MLARRITARFLACLLGGAPAYAGLIDDPYGPLGKVPCKHQMAPSKAEGPKEHEEFWRRWNSRPFKKRDRIQELEDRVQQLEMRQEERR